jgi:hypothetical protein
MLLHEKPRVSETSFSGSIKCRSIRASRLNSEGQIVQNISLQSTAVATYQPISSAASHLGFHCAEAPECGHSVIVV